MAETPSVRKNIQDMPFFGRGQDPLKSFTVCVAFEFIEGKHPGQRETPLTEVCMSFAISFMLHLRCSSCMDR